MAIYDFFLSRNGAASTPQNYVGHLGRLFYSSNTGEIRLSDGVTPGGLPIPITLATETVPGGVKLGPGIILNSEGQILIDSSGLEFSFGDFQGIVGTYTDSTAYALLSSVNADEDIVIASNGDGAVKVVGQFDIYKTNGTVTGSLEEAEPFFRVKEDGQVRILVPLADTTEGGVEIIGSLLGTALAPGIAGTMLHITGNAGESTRVYHDTLSDYGSYVFRRYNGSVASPTAVLVNEDIGRINFTAATSSGMGNVATSQIRITALENQTPTAQGSKMVFTVTPIGAAATSRVDVATISTADGVSATKFTGPLTGNVTGNVSGNAGTVTNGVYTTDTGTVTNTMLAGSIANNKLSNSTISGIALGSNLAALTINGYLTGTSYNGSTAVTIAVDATTAATANKVVARDASGDIFARIVSDSLGNIRSIPINNKVASYILAATDNGQMISITTGGVTVNTGVFASPFGQSISIYNNSASSQTITQGAGVTLRLAGTTATGNRTLARYGVATIVCVASETFVISGAGLV